MRSSWWPPTACCRRPTCHPPPAAKSALPNLALPIQPASCLANSIVSAWHAANDRPQATLNVTARKRGHGGGRVQMETASTGHNCGSGHRRAPQDTQNCAPAGAAARCAALRAMQTTPRGRRQGARGRPGARPACSAWPARLPDRSRKTAPAEVAGDGGWAGEEVGCMVELRCAHEDASIQSTLSSCNALMAGGCGRCWPVGAEQRLGHSFPSTKPCQETRSLPNASPTTHPPTCHARRCESGTQPRGITTVATAALTPTNHLTHLAGLLAHCAGEHLHRHVRRELQAVHGRKHVLVCTTGGKSNSKGEA